MSIIDQKPPPRIRNCDALDQWQGVADRHPDREKGQALTETVRVLRIRLGCDDGAPLPVRTPARPGQLCRDAFFIGTGRAQRMRKAGRT